MGGLDPRDRGSNLSKVTPSVQARLLVATVLGMCGVKRGRADRALTDPIVDTDAKLTLDRVPGVGLSFGHRALLAKDCTS